MKHTNQVVLMYVDTAFQAQDVSTFWSDSINKSTDNQLYERELASFPSDATEDT